MRKLLSFGLVLTLLTLLNSCKYLEEIFPRDQPGNNTTRTYNAFLSGDQQVPAVPASGAGEGTFTLNREEDRISFKLVVANTDKILFAHIHLAPIGENGPVVAPLLMEQRPATGLVNGVLVEGVIKKEDLTGPLEGKPLADLIGALETGQAYANIHTEDFPAGELRGQIGRAKTNVLNSFSSFLTGNQEVPPVQTDATGQASYTFNLDATELTFRVDLSKIEDVKFSHIHLGPVGVNGPVIAPLKMTRVDGPVNGRYAEGKITAADLTGNLEGGPLSILKAALESGRTYTNVHTDQHPAGEIRGQNH